MRLSWEIEPLCTHFPWETPRRRTDLPEGTSREEQDSQSRLMSQYLRGTCHPALVSPTPALSGVCVCGLCVYVHVHSLKLGLTVYPRLVLNCVPLWVSLSVCMFT